MPDAKDFETRLFNIELEFVPTTPDSFSNLVAELKLSQFRTPGLKAHEVLIELENFIPKLSMQAEFASMDIFEKRIRLSVGGERITLPSPLERKILEVTEEVLRPLESDLNFVLALFLGGLNLKQSDVKMKGRISMRRPETQLSFIDSLFRVGASQLANWTNNANYTGVYSRVEEQVAGIAMKTVYNFERRETETSINVSYDGRLAGSLSLVEIAKTLREHALVQCSRIWSDSQ